MKKLIWASIVITLAAVLLPAITLGMGLSTLALPAPTAGESAEPSDEAQPKEPVQPESGGAKMSDADFIFTVLLGEKTAEYSMQDYLPGAVAAEMPASFNLEALKAQAVAARTYICYCAGHENPNHPEADVCVSPGCCLAYLDENGLRGAWGASFQENMELISAACAETDGEILRYEGEPVLAAFHSSSAGKTEDGAELWGETPYLKSVDSPETGADVPEFETTVEVSALNLKETILAVRGDADFSGWPEEWLGSVERDGSGRVRSLSVGGITLTGQELRSLFSLRSTAFTLECADRVFVFHVTGFGHGLGMSQYGAEVMARGGSEYTEILAHYYPETKIAWLG